ncbi:TIGR03905 family TSCPD domain-containing protein [bacterium]|nr:TIGR03905 family TSCPD domain-containing protein [bacterium]OLA73070.1 MAG: TIGR03905 family protein [Acinetobacter sp. CAG:196_36_41]
MSDNIQIKEVNGVDIVQYQPKGVCCKMMQMRIKDNIIQDVEFVGGCNGNLSGIGVLVKGMNINDIVPKLSGIPCGARPTSCPDQLTKGIQAYLEAKRVNVAEKV